MNRQRQAKAARKPPRQSRSRATVEAILDATIRILDQAGAESASTSRIAEVAGVSVGTLYQYFANRDAIIDALQDREFERAIAMIHRLLVTGTVKTERSIANAVVRGLSDLYRSSPALHRLLVIEGLQITPAERVQAFDAKIVGAVRSFLSVTGLPLRRSNLDAAAFVVFQSVRATMLSYLLERPPTVSEEALTEELTDLLLRYLVQDS
jgi:AcrR family transcriptional regulator